MYDLTQIQHANPTLHDLCLRYVEWREFPSIYNGLICGSSGIDVATKELFLATGLYHLIVVSGSHLSFIEHYLDKLRPRLSIIKWLCLFLFSYMCLLNAPILRALIHYSAAYVERRFYLCLRKDQMVLMAGLVTISLFPHWIMSLSLQLSWMAALCMSLQVSTAKKAFLCLVYITPLLGLQNPMWALNNFLFMSAFEVFLFPFTVITLAVPWTSALAHYVWDATYMLLQHLPSSSPSTEFPPSITTNWIFVFSAQLTHYWIRK